MSVILETPRLILRELEQTDFAELCELLQDPRVMYAYEHDFTKQDVQDWLDRQRMRYQKYGFGLWAIILKETGKFIGEAGLTMQPYKGGEVLEVGYQLKYAFWHHGYAHEAAAACKDYAFEKLRANKVHSVIKVDNRSSIKVAESIGMSREDTFITQYYNGDMLHYLYSVHK